MNVKKLMKIIGVSIGIIISLFFLFAICKIIIFRIYMMDDIRVRNGKVQYEEAFLPKDIKLIDVKIDKEESNKIIPINDEKLYFNGKELKISKHIFQMNLRLYVPLEETLKEMQIKLEKENDNFNIEDKVNFNIFNNFYKKDGENKELRGKCLIIKDKVYISLNDLEEFLNLRDRWSNNLENIYLFKDKKYKKPNKAKNIWGKAALIRLEDVASGGVFGNNENREKLKIMSDYLYSQGIIFHLAWVPRYVEPKKNIDNDFLKNHSMSNVQFINILDHLINRGAVIGLHGYTHQYGNTVSTIGVELSPSVNNNENATKEVAESAIKTAKTLNIPYSFFETPHYRATRKEQKILEKYFRVLYEPYGGFWNLKPLISLNNRNTIYVPTPLGYVKDDDGKIMANRIKRNSTGEKLSSLFVHPFKELKYIELKNIDKDGYGDYVYNQDSPLQNIVQALKETGHVTIRVDNLK
ncbi:DUF2334 domain-containing protein [Clostridium tarantellae]|uniref:DUF2334 domain-containing protein n=1 Tax=Clostridium tarantellae TaxID=39493 RepID=A0A6I1MPG6_9CLOT|nr:DUF2334 domain-containing protein [Clostridium tarantellae]MPQ44017.1 DUF2334 domain-containing protein [Clostridium tarantellae]